MRSAPAWRGYDHHERATIRRSLEEAAGVEAQFEAIQSTETPLEFLLRKMRDISRVHLCRSRQAVTKPPVTKSGGRPPIGEKAMTGADRMRKLRATRRALTRTVSAT